MAQTVLVTGGAGFVGHHVIKYILKHTDWNVVSLDRLDFSGNLNRLADMMAEFTPVVQKRLSIVHHDLRAEINPLVASQIGDVEYILHLAAGSHVDRSIEHPMEFVLDNVVGTCNILNFGRTQPKLQRFVYFSTDEVFGPARDNVTHKEFDSYNSNNPYAASKAGGEELAVAFRNTYKMPIYITHTMNVFGERQHPEKFIPMCINKIRKGESVTIHSDATKTKAGSRYYIHADDVASALLFILDLPTVARFKFNIVGAEEVDNLSLAQRIADIQHTPLRYQMVDFHSSRPGHDLRYALDGGYMEALGWKSSCNFQKRLEQVVSWTLSSPMWGGV